MDKPLAGLKVLELARILAGPWAGQLLADLGAEVIKVERPGEGDDTRHWGPPFAADGATAYFHACNRGKTSVAIDLRTPSGQEQVRALAAQSDVLIENFKVGGLTKYGLDYPSLSALDPGLVYCSITGFGQTGPYAPRAGYDFIIQGMGGAMSLTGEPDGEPQKSGVAYADLFTGLYSTVAILAALRDPHRMGNGHANLVPYRAFHVSDGEVIVAVGNDRQFARLCDLLGRLELAEDERFRTNPARVANRAVLIPLLEEAMLKRSCAEFSEALEAAGIPSGPINPVDAVFADPQVIHRGMRIERDGMPSLASPIVIDGKRQVADRGSPRLPDE